MEQTTQSPKGDKERTKLRANRLFANTLGGVVSHREKLGESMVRTQDLKETQQDREDTEEGKEIIQEAKEIDQEEQTNGKEQDIAPEGIVETAQPPRSPSPTSIGDQSETVEPMSPASEDSSGSRDSRKTELFLKVKYLGAQVKMLTEREAVYKQEISTLQRVYNSVILF